jgi:hypothetical protein
MVESPRMDSVQTFHLPPKLHNARGEVRKAGFELEYAGVDLEQSARIVMDVFGGTEQVDSTFVRSVQTELGRFSVEIDTRLLKDKTYEGPLRAIGVDPARTDLQWLEDALLGTFSTLVPIEIATPPIAIDHLDPLDALRRRLAAAKARGTRAFILYAFGMHINPEIPSDDPAELLDILRAFLLLHPWIKEKAQVDIARRISPYINSFPDAYARLVLRDDYVGSRECLIDDYLTYNPTRNRALDLLPILAHLDHDRVLAKVEDPLLVKARPAFHYRLPNCMIDEPGWSLASEWNLWVLVERVAADRELLAHMSRTFLEADRVSLKPFVDRWPDLLNSYLGEP